MQNKLFVATHTKMTFKFFPLFLSARLRSHTFSVFNKLSFFMFTCFFQKYIMFLLILKHISLCIDMEEKGILAGVAENRQHDT